MTLNFSHSPVFPLPNASSGTAFIPTIQDKGGDVFGRPCCIKSGTNESYSYGRDSGGVNNAGSWEPTCTDIVDLLPSDPFGMNLDSTFKAALAFCIGDMATNYQCDHRRDSHAEFNYYNTSVWFPPEPGLPPAYSSEFLDEGLPGLLDCTPQVGVLAMSSDVNYGYCGSDWAGEAWNFNVQTQEQADHEGMSVYGGETSVPGRSADIGTADFLLEEAGEHLEGAVEAHEELFFEKNRNGAEYGDGEPPHEGLLFALRHLGVKDLLSVERVCKRLHFAVQTDTLLWRCFHVQQPLSEKLTDEALFHLTQRAEGRLQCLDLVECVGITDVGLKRVIESNPGITKLSVPGCARLTVEGVVNSLKLFKTPGTPHMRYLRVGGIYGATLSHYEDLKLLVGMDRCKQQQKHKPRFYHNGFSSPSCDYGTAIDIELCPRCQDLRLVYDCPTDSCQGKASDPCRACMLCIPRCATCGRCLTDGEYEETFCLEFVCMDCWTHFAQCEKDRNQVGQEIGANPKKILSLASRRMGAFAFNSVTIMDYE